VTSLRIAARDLKVYVASALVIVLAVAIGWWAAVLRPDTRPALTSALDVLPARTTIVGFTDWSRIRDHVGLGTVDARGERADLESRAAKRDLATRSVLGRSVDEMHAGLGWSPADVEWEVYGQDPVGAASVVRLGGSISVADVRNGLEAAGYAQDGTTWRAPEGTSRLPEILTNVALVPRQRLVVMSDDVRQMSDVLAVVAGKARSLAAGHAAADTARALAGSDSVLLQGGRLACQTTAIARDAELQRQARTAVERAGALESYRFSGRGLSDRGGSGFSAQHVVFAMTFDSAVEASEQADVRARLATGPFIGRTGPIDETLRLRSADADEATARLDFAHDPATNDFMTGTGPVLFASC
jgi:hypothetical protein